MEILIIVLLSLLILVSILVMLNKSKLEVPEREREEILIHSNGVRVNMTLYARVLSAKISRGDYVSRNANYIEHFKRESLKQFPELQN
jgi:hypothetical protein